MLIFTITGGCSQKKDEKANQVTPRVETTAQKIQLNTTPTLFFHGALSSYRSEEDIVKAAINAGISNSVIRANVDPDGKVKLIGKIAPNNLNPIIEVNYENNVQLNYEKAGTYASNVVKTLKDKYIFNEVNMVGHSLGNISIMYYLLQNANDKDMPKLNKQVSIAGHFAGVDLKNMPVDLREPSHLKLDKKGRPNHMNKSYQQMTKLRKRYSKNQVDVLNIIGDVENNSDGFISNASSLSLEYLANNYAKTYRVEKYFGKEAEHGRLTYNPQVKSKIITFLWD